MVATARIDSNPRTASSDAGGGSYSVERGDTLSQIASQAGVSLQALIGANPQISNPNRIYPGDRLHIPAAVPGSPPAGRGGPAAGNAAGMHLSDSGVDLIKNFEGLRLSAYQDSGGVWTIGYGHTGGVKAGDRITQGQAEALLRQDTGWAQDAVRQQVRVPLTQDQFNALTSFTFNLGAGALRDSTLLSKLNAGDYAGAQAEFGRFVHAGGRVLQGLVRRRAAEADLFGSHAPSGTAAGAPGSATAPRGNDDSNSNGADGSRSTRARGGDHTVRRGDTLWAIARQNGVSLQALIAANPQLANPNLIHPGQTVHLPGDSPGGAVGSAPAGSAAPAVAPGAATGDAGDAAAIARQYLHRNASELKRSGDLPMDRSVPSNICCANFVSAVLQRAGLLPDRLHTNSVDQLDSTLRARGWRPVDVAHARPGDVVIIQGGGASHTVMVESNQNGHLKLIGSNNVNADGTQQVTVGSATWALSHGAVILAPPST